MLPPFFTASSFTHEHRLREATGERGERNERCCFNDGAVISTLPSQSRRKKKKRKENDHGVLLSNTPFFPSNFCLKSGSFPFSVFSWQRVTGRGRRDLRNLAAKKQKECVDPHSSSINVASPYQQFRQFWRNVTTKQRKGRGQGLGQKGAKKGKKELVNTQTR